MQIDKSLNLVVPVDSENGTVYCHSSPIRKETFKEHFLILSKTLNRLYSEGVSQLTGPRVAALMLEKIAKEDGIWESEDGRIGVKDSLLNEIRRLTNVICATSDGWKSIPLMDAAKAGKLTESDVEEAEGYIVFFTCISHLHKKKEVEAFLKPMETLWGTQSTSLSVMEYAASLQTSKQEETSLPEQKPVDMPTADNAQVVDAQGKTSTLSIPA